MNEHPPIATWGAVGASAAHPRSEHGQPAVSAERAHAHELVRGLGRPLCTGNRVELLDGAAANAALARAIDGAADHVNLCGELVSAAAGADVADRLIARLRAGVRVNLCCDGLDTLGFAAPALERLAAEGLSLCRPAAAPAWTPPWPRRGGTVGTPGPLLVADGRRALLGAGGVDADGRSALLLSLEGPAVRRLQQLFLRQWCRRSLRPVQPARYFPPLMAAGTHRLGLFDSDDPTLQTRALLGALHIARERVLLCTAAAVPGHRLGRALTEAALRGVDVTLLRRGAESALAATRGLWQALAHAGIEVHEQPGLPGGPTELCTIDGVWAGFAGRDAAARLVLLDRPFVRGVEQMLRRELDAAPLAASCETGESTWLRWKHWVTQRIA